MDGTPVLKTEVNAWLKKLATPLAAAGVAGGSVVVHRVRGKRQVMGALYHVQLDMATAGRPITIGYVTNDVHPHEDVFVAIRDAFRVLSRRIGNS